MKTTTGKTKTPTRQGRIVRITSSARRGGIVATVEAKSLRAALENYWAETLSDKRYAAPVYVGNTLTVTDPTGHECVYTALEAK